MNICEYYFTPIVMLLVFYLVYKNIYFFINGLIFFSTELLEHCRIGSVHMRALVCVCVRAVLTVYSCSARNERASRRTLHRAAAAAAGAASASAASASHSIFSLLCSVHRTPPPLTRAAF